MTPESSGWTLSRIWGTLRKLWGVIAATVLAGALVTFAATSVMTPHYESTSTLAFSAGKGSTSQELADGSTYMQTQMPTYAQLATSSAVLQPVIDDLGLKMSVNDLKKLMVVTIPQNTLVLQVAVSWTSAQESATVANAVAQSLTTVVRQVAPKPASGQRSAINVTLVDKAVAPAHQTSPDKVKDSILGALGGFIIGVLAVLVWTLLDTRIPTPQALKQLTGASLLGSVSRVRTPSRLWVAEDPSGQTAEEFRRIASALTYATFDKRARSIIVTSSGPGEGKSAISANLALTLASLGSRVLLIDADLRRPRVAASFGLVDVVGLTTVLMDRTPLPQAIQKHPGSDLDVLASGALPPNPAEFLTSERMRTLLKEAAEHYDFVLIDSPPVLSVADTALLAPLTDGTLVVVDAKHTRQGALTATVTGLEGAGGRITGMVLNRARLTRRGNRRYGEYLSEKPRKPWRGPASIGHSPTSAAAAPAKSARRGQ
ncbi:polysaccharide biosynthesis tyrosine autokinase [Acidipropionibacterium virtanenii]|uniref:Tyrosine-protein kinase YwqD n=1 Tax=Acidipropionibacterium virtanenii TaxID=2057246 RepID=A0A344UWM2_9ACTN|nr:polysaccharide biosynthesis tyrosine autokinase [Acidipropionibacterium virtanenii]AXE39670.1 Tyrosine-protein kinase YwqD [Acidipropionibacterium virtanenii]